MPLKTEQAIREALRQIKTFLERADPILDKKEVEKRQPQVILLEWILGGIPGPGKYYCLRCHCLHETTKCPICGDVAV